jgi:hypothetical protein
MSMYSGIGSFAKFAEGGGAQQQDGGSSGGSGLPGVGPSGGAGAPLTREEFLAKYGINGEGFIGGVTGDVAYQAYLQAFNLSGGNVDVTNGNVNVRAKTLPSYMSLTENNQVLIPEGTTNRQFIEAMNMLGLLPEDDYAWLTQYFSGAGGDATWLAARYNQPDTNINRDNFFGNNDLNAENTSIMNRLFDVFDTGSQAGGFTASQGFLNEYSTPTTAGQYYGADASRPVFIGQPPTGGTAEQPYYSLSDVLVSSSEQPNLYDRFDPYPSGGFPQVDPYQRPVTTQYSYRPPLVTTPSLTFDTGEADPVTGTVDEPDTTTTTTGTGGTGLGGDGTTTTDTTTTDTTTTDTTTGTTDTTTTDTTDTTTPSATVDRYAPDAEGYIRVAGFKDLDPYIYGKRASLWGQKVRQGSRRDLSAQEFMDVLSGQSGTGAYGGDLIYDPDRGIIYSGVSDRMDEARRKAFMDEIEYRRGRQSVPLYVDPALMNDVERIRSKHLTGGLGLGATRIGDTQYFVNEDGSVTAYDVKDIEYDFTPGFGRQNRSDVGFAEGGIVDVYSGDMANLQTTGEGIESFLNPERSKATLRRNLAKLAPRPTAPVMQQGIMPMAR